MKISFKHLIKLTKETDYMLFFERTSKIRLEAGCSYFVLENIHPYKQWIKV